MTERSQQTFAVL